MNAIHDPKYLHTEKLDLNYVLAQVDAKAVVVGLPVVKAGRILTKYIAKHPLWQVTGAHVFGYKSFKGCANCAIEVDKSISELRLIAQL